jgi:hypothetical protein
MRFINRLYQEPDRPLAVTHAVLLLYALLAVSLLVYILQVLLILVLYTEERSLATLPINVLWNVVFYALNYYVVRKIAEGRNWARWLLLIGFGLILMSSLPSFTRLANDFVGGVMVLVQLVGTAIALALLFQGRSSQWFKPAAAEELNPNTKAVSARQVEQADEILLSADLVVWLIARPRIVATFALSALVGILVAAVVDYRLLGNAGFVAGSEVSGTLGCGVFGAAICCTCSLFGMVVALHLNRKGSNDQTRVVKPAAAGALLGIIPGGVVTAFFVLVAWGFAV